MRLAIDMVGALKRRLPGETATVSALLVISIVCFAALGLHLVLNVEMQLSDRLMYYGLLIGLFYCCITYQLSRFGAARRAARHRLFRDDEVEYLFSPDAPAVAILIPSYREERRVIVMTMLSAALARYSNRRIVLLVDDPPSDRASVANTLAAVAEVREMIAKPVTMLRNEQDAWRLRLEMQAVSPGYEVERLALAYRRAADWLEEQARFFEAETTPEFLHVDRFFIERILRDLAARHRREAASLALRQLSIAEIEREYAKLAALFCDDISSFQRKTFANLSHAPNKAMNLNAYIGLMGGRYRVREAGGKRFLEPAADGPMTVRAPDYVLTLDADSVVSADYILQLAHILESNERLGVAQTPYLAFPHSREAVERIAGATTDIQYLVHQGATFYNASYWVGANALIRYPALQAIRRDQEEAGKSCPVFIQDETVIEDTGSTIDLLRAGWSVHNFFAPLAYSATPGDFGALAIQRKRWSNGGLIIFPMLLRQYLASPGRLKRLPELTLRSHYLLSPLIGNAAVFTLMVWASRDGRALIWTPLVMLPYFLLYGTDLRRLGYRLHDLFAVCALNLMLLPVSFAGIGASIRQIVTGRKGSFSRTPKVADRTFVPPYAFLFNSFMLCLMTGYVVQGLLTREYLGTIIPAANVTLYLYGLSRFVGFRNGFSDLALGLRARLAEGVERPAFALSGLVPRPVRLGRAAVLAALFILMPMQFGATSGQRNAAMTFAVPDAALAQAASPSDMAVMDLRPPRTAVSAIDAMAASIHFGHRPSAGLQGLAGSRVEHSMTMLARNDDPAGTFDDGARDGLIFGQALGAERAPRRRISQRNAGCRTTAAGGCPSGRRRRGDSRLESDSELATPDIVARRSRGIAG